MKKARILEESYKYNKRIFRKFIIDGGSPSIVCHQIGHQPRSFLNRFDDEDLSEFEASLENVNLLSNTARLLQLEEENFTRALEIYEKAQELISQLKLQDSKEAALLTEFIKETKTAIDGR